MPSRSPRIMIGSVDQRLLGAVEIAHEGGDAAFVARAPRACTSAWRASVSTILAPELRNASSRRRCSSVLKSNSICVNVLGLGRNVTSVPRLALGRRRRPSAAPPATPSRNSIKCSLPSRQTRHLQPGRQRVDDRHADAVQAARDLVGVLVELAAGVQLGEDDFGRRALGIVVVVVLDADRECRGRRRARCTSRPGSA